MNPWQYLKIAFGSLNANKVRSFLTMLGVVIGVFSVITFLGIGEGLKREFNKQFDDFGSNLLYVLPGKVEGFEGLASTNGASTLSLKDVETIETQTANVESLTPYMQVAGVISHNGKPVIGPILIATNHKLPLIQNIKIEEGAYFTQQQVSANARVAFLGSAAKKKIFGNAKVYGRTIRIFNQDFIVIGSQQENPSNFSLGPGGPESFVYIPISTAQELTRSEQVSQILVKAKSAEGMSLAQQEIKSLLLDNHGGEEDFSVVKQDELVGLFNDLLGNLSKAISGIGAISLLVGGIGIMNIMFVSVTERTREIGLRKALGATNSNILWQFLVESATLSILGGAIGIGLAYLLTYILESAVNLPTHITYNAIALAFGLSLAIGIIFGIVPAFKASRRNPIEALRYE
jgi:putative ABC transport system permease protein